MDNILEQYMQQVKEDKMKENNDFPEDTFLTEEEREEYEKRLNEIRNDEHSIENQYEIRKTMLQEYKEDKLEELGLIKETENVTFKVKHAFCENCGKELTTDMPPLFNPFTKEKICKHVCDNCGSYYNLEFSYPRLVVCDEEGNEINVFLR